jgi:hypothetical protein
MTPNGYNLVTGGNSWKRSEELNKKHGAIRLGKPSGKKGKKYPGSNKKQSLRWRGKAIPHLHKPEVNAKIAASNTGKKRTLEKRINISRAHCTPFILEKDGVQVGFYSTLEAELFLGCGRHSVSKLVTNLRASLFGWKVVGI